MLVPFDVRENTMAAQMIEKSISPGFVGLNELSITFV